MRVAPQDAPLPHGSRKSAVCALFMTLSGVALGASVTLLLGNSSLGLEKQDDGTNLGPGLENSVSDTNSTESEDICNTTCSFAKDQDRFGLDLSNTEELLARVVQERENFKAKLKKDYGEENYYNIFELTGRQRRIFRAANGSTGPSVERLKRKLMIKILQVQLGIEQERRFRELCQCTEDGVANYTAKATTNSGFNAEVLWLRYDTEEEEFGTTNVFPELDQKAPFYARYIWVNGGDSAAAGHGNYFEQSYTSVMERTVKHVFAAIGIDFVGKNYAMNATGSGEEITFCVQSIFGRDVDSLVWNFASTNNSEQEVWKLLVYAYQAAHLPGRPALFGMLKHDNTTTTSDSYQQQEAVLQSMENLGMTSLVLDNSALSEMEASIPDTNSSLTEDQISSMPELVRYFKCYEIMEGGDPGCTSHKFDLGGQCDDREAMTVENPGWYVVYL